MISNFVDWYFTSLADFWNFGVRIRLLHILIAIAIIYWLRRKGCFKDCCWCSWFRCNDSQSYDCSSDEAVHSQESHQDHQDAEPHEDQPEEQSNDDSNADDQPYP